MIVWRKSWLSFAIIWQKTMFLFWEHLRSITFWFHYHLTKIVILFHYCWWKLPFFTWSIWSFDENRRFFKIKKYRNPTFAKKRPPCIQWSTEKILDFFSWNPQHIFCFLLDGQTNSAMCFCYQLMHYMHYFVLKNDKNCV